MHRKGQKKILSYNNKCRSHGGNGIVFITDRTALIAGNSIFPTAIYLQCKDLFQQEPLETSVPKSVVFHTFNLINFVDVTWLPGSVVKCNILFHL